MKKYYQRPAVQLVLLQHHCPLLSGSDNPNGIRGEISGYTNNGGGFEQDEKP